MSIYSYYLSWLTGWYASSSWVLKQIQSLLCFECAWTEMAGYCFLLGSISCRSRVANHMLKPLLISPGWRALRSILDSNISYMWWWHSAYLMFCSLFLYVHLVWMICSWNMLQYKDIIPFNLMFYMSCSVSCHLQYCIIWCLSYLSTVIFYL